jgi:hypothetical protein
LIGIGSLNDEEEREHWQSLNAYAGRLTRDGSADLILFAKYAIEGLLEEDLEHGLVDDVPGSILECRMAVVAEWVIHCGQRLVAQEEDGIDVENWQNCKEKFCNVSDKASMSPHTRERVQKAIQAMEAL